MSNLVSEEVKQIFSDVLERAGDCYTCLKFEEAGIKLAPSDIPETYNGIKTHHDIHSLPVIGVRIDICRKVAIFYKPYCNGEFVKIESLNSNGNCPKIVF